MIVALLGLVVLVVGINVGPTGASPPIRFRGSSTARKLRGVLASVSARDLVLQTADGRRTSYLVDNSTFVCGRHAIGCREGAARRLEPGSRVWAQVGTDARGHAHASTIFVTDQAGNVQVDAIDGNELQVHDDRHGLSYTLAIRPFTVLVDAAGETRARAESFHIGDRFFFVGVDGVVHREPVTLPTRIFPFE
jgi:hypothetical protein